MKWFSLLSAASMLAMGTVSSADEWARSGNSVPARSGFYYSVASPTVGDARFVDYPTAAYPAGFSSYRGVGFMGACCDSKPGSGEAAWSNYCQTKDSPAKLCDGKFRGWLRGACCQPQSCFTGCGASCEPAGCFGPGANYWPMSPCAPPLGYRLRSLGGFFSSGCSSCSRPGCSGCTPAAVPQPAPAPQVNQPAPEQAAPIQPPPDDSTPAPAAPGLPDPPATPAAPANPAPPALNDPPAAPPAAPASPAPNQAARGYGPMLGQPAAPVRSIVRPSPSDKSARRPDREDLRRLPTVY